jgi:hypothetical protein
MSNEDDDLSPKDRKELDSLLAELERNDKLVDDPIFRLRFRALFDPKGVIAELMDETLNRGLTYADLREIRERRLRERKH